MSASHLCETHIFTQAIPLTKTTTTTKPTSPQRAPPHLLACSWLLFLLLSLLQSFSRPSDISLIVSAQTTANARASSLIRIIDQNNLISSTPPASNQQPTTRFLSTLPTTTLANSPNQQQTKTLKFTIVAGKYWKFNIKQNTFTSHKEGELRLHKNISANNYIIDDESWFQYNPLQQQLFAWPSLRVKPGTYQFVLLPSGVDFEADSENAVGDLDIAANIIVELIRPVYPQISNDIDQLIDYKFSLDFLHRHSKYPLLVNQIIAVFEALSTNNNKQSLYNNTLNLNPTTTTISPTTLPDKLKGSSRPANKLLEFLLIEQSYSSDGEFFSLTWTTQPSLVNNTITQIQECRLSTIGDVITKLSNFSSGYSSPDDKYILYYPLETSSNVDSQAILSTERGNHLLKLNLNEPCQKPKVLDELGIVISTSESYTNKPLEVVSITRSIDSVDKENNQTIIRPLQTELPSSGQTETSRDSQTVSTPPRLPSPEAIDLDTAPTSGPILLRTAINNSTIVTTTSRGSSTIALPSTFSSEPISKTTTTSPPTTQTDVTQPPPPANVSVSEPQDSAPNELLVEKVNKTTLEAQAPANKPDNKLDSENITSTTTTPVADTTTSSDNINLLSTQQPKVLLQTKSSINLDANDSPVISTITSMSSDLQQTPVVAASYPSTTTPPLINMPNSSKVISSDPRLNNNDIMAPAAPIKETTNPTINPETGLNEDLIGILDNIMNYLVSVAVPASIIIGSILVISIIIALCHLCIKRRRSKQFQVKNRFKFRYGSERRGFLKNSSKPVILDADRKSLSCGGPTPTHQPTTSVNEYNTENNSKNDKRSGLNYLQMHPIKGAY